MKMQVITTKTLNFAFCLLFLGVVFVATSCKEDTVPDEIEPTEKFSLKGLRPSFGENFNFLNRPIPITGASESELVKNLLATLEELLGESDEITTEESQFFIPVDFQVIRQKEEFILTLLRENSADDAESHLGDKIGHRDMPHETTNASQETIVVQGSCPKGQDKVKTCFSQDCVSDQLTEFGNHMQVGDSFSVHYKRTGVVICANPRLKDAAEK